MSDCGMSLTVSNRVYHTPTHTRSSYLIFFLSLQPLPHHPHPPTRSGRSCAAAESEDNHGSGFRDGSSARSLTICTIRSFTFIGVRHDRFGITPPPVRETEPQYVDEETVAEETVRGLFELLRQIIPGPDGFGGSSWSRRRRLRLPTPSRRRLRASPSR